MALRLPDHGHCEECGDPVALDRRFCSEECVDLYLDGIKAQKKKDWTFYGAMIVSLVAIAIVSIAVRLL